MIGKANSQTRPTALGTLVNASTYGLAIPLIYGMPKVSLLAIWAANLRMGSSGKKGKGKKKGTPMYVENIDFLIGHNPIIGINQIWNNATKYPLNFVNISFNGGYTPVPHTYTITDAQFYSVIAVVWVSTYSVTFNDYGGYGPVTLSGTFEIPLWNECVNGPNSAESNGYKLYPYVYSWVPSSTLITFPVGGIGDIPVGVTGCKLYYTQTSSALHQMTPLAYSRLTFEPVLADGSEYSGYSGQQVLMPPYAGAGSPNYDLGSTGAIPNTQVEVQSMGSVYPTGDCDFADMIEDVIASGFAQVSPADQTTAQTQQAVQHGAALFDFPDVIQKRYLSYGTTIGNPTSLAYEMANQAGSTLIAMWAARSSGAPTGFTDTAGNTWINLDVQSVGGINWILAYAVASAYIPGNAVSVQCGGNYGSANSYFIAELPPGMAFDTSVASTVAVANMNTVQITTGNQTGRAAFILGFAFDFAVDPTGFDPNWSPFCGIPLDQYNDYVGYGESRTVWSPGTYYMQDNIATGTVRVCLASFIQTGPSTTPRTYGSILDRPSMAVCRTQARAYGFFGSLALTDQSSARDICKTLYQSMNSAPYYSGDTLKQAPYGEISAVGNGAIYTSPYASGPVATLSDLNGDFLGSASTPPLTVERTPQLELPAIIKYQIPARISDYNPVSVSQPDSGTLSLFGVRAFETEMHNEIADPAVALALIGIQTRRQSLIRNMVKFSTGPRYLLMEPMDLITLTETLNGLSVSPYRLTSVTISNTFQVNFEAEPFKYGVHSPLGISSPTVTPYQPYANNDPGSVNGPIIFEPPLRMSDNIPEIWIVVSGASPNYGGCIPNMSVDGGTSYQTLQQSALENGTTGALTADYPVSGGGNPDDSDVLSVDLTESNGSLESFNLSERDNLQGLCYIQADPTPTPTILGSATYYSASIPSPASIGIPLAVTLAGGALFQGSDLVLYFMRYRGGPLKGTMWFGNVGQSGLNTFTTYLGNYQNPSTGAISWTGLMVGEPILFGPSGAQQLENFQKFWDASGSGDLPFDIEMTVVIIRGGRILYSPHAEWSTANDISPLTNAITTYTYSQAATPSYPWLSMLLQIDPLTPGSAPILINWTTSDGATWGTLPSGWSAVRSSDALTQLNTATGVPGSPEGIYEIVAYGIATQTSAYNYDMGGLGGANPVYRSVYGIPPEFPLGIDHASTARFAFLGQPESTNVNGLLKFNMDPKWIGQELWFKFQAVNLLTGNLQPLADATAYSYTVIGNMIPSPSYSLNPITPLYLVITGTYPTSLSVSIATPALSITFADTGETLNYLATALVIQSPTDPAPSGETTYYAYLFDPQQSGGLKTMIFSTIPTSLGVFGYWFVGTITVNWSDITAITSVSTPGGWPQTGGGFLVNGQ